MRAREFIAERKFKDRKSSVLSTMYHFPSMPGDSAYQIYRFGLTMANPEIEHVDGPAAAQAVVMAYTDEEEAIVQRAMKKTGHTGQLLTDKGSTEPKTVTTRSPINSFKGYPR
jgi:hypothetical protein